MNKLSLLFVFVAALPLGACGGDSTTDTFDDFVASANRMTSLQCDCEPDPAACKTDNAMPQTAIDCMRDLVSANEDAVAASLECIAAATADAADCLASATCTDESAQSTCLETYDTASEACPEIPAALDDMFEACFPA